MMSHPDLCWERPDAAARAGMNQEELEAEFANFLSHVDSTISHPGAACPAKSCSSAAARDLVDTFNKDQSLFLMHACC